MRVRPSFLFVPLALLSPLGVCGLLACSSGGGIDPFSVPREGGTDPGDGGRVSKDGGRTPAGECSEGFRLFNGDCHRICTKGADCDDGTHCIAVDDEESMCLPYDECAYLGSDTQCVAYGGWYGYTRGGGSTFYPYQSTPGADPNDVSSQYDPYFQPQPYWAVTGPCQGNAKWITLPAQGSVACSDTHSVQRCRFNYTYHRCELGPGITREFVQP